MNSPHQDAVLTPPAEEKKKKSINGSQAVMLSLVEEGVDTIFGYPGGAIMPIYDALYDYSDSLRHILVRHERAAFMLLKGMRVPLEESGWCLLPAAPVLPIL